MKPRFLQWMPVLAAGFVALLWSGCYTQFGSKWDESASRNADQDQYAYDDSVAASEDYDSARERFYDQNYYSVYPSTYGFSDPWGYRYRPGFGYDSYWYDPYWGWCGTSYPFYSAWWSHTGYGHRSSLFYDPVHRGGSGIAGRTGDSYGSSRSFGSTRSSGGMRGETGYAPGGTRSGGNWTAPSAGTYQTAPRKSSVSSGRTAERPARLTPPAGSRGGSREGTRSVAPRSYPRPSSGRAGGSEVRPSSPPPSSPGSSGGNSGSRDSNRGERSGGSYTPPASSSPAPSAPPPSSGTAPPANTGERGGNKR
jgi:hypothetical protein